jgi:flavin reductase (DIM6/NTAB) family NADH-FMN oxidoreductase RutF
MTLPFLSCCSEVRTIYWNFQAETCVTFDNRRFRDALSQFPTGVAIITALVDGEKLGMTVSSFNSLSLDPPLVLFSIYRKALSFSAWQQAKNFGVSILNVEQEELSNRFARSKGDKWSGVETTPGTAGTPILPDAVVTFECEAFDRYDGGDHEIFVGRVIALHEAPAHRGQSLVFFGGQYRSLREHGAHNVPKDSHLQGWEGLGWA